MKVHWNSTYVMLHSCVGYENIISSFYNTYKYDDMITNDDWKIAFEKKTFLEIFYKGTLTCYAVYKPTSNEAGQFHVFLILWKQNFKNIGRTLQ